MKILYEKHICFINKEIPVCKAAVKLQFNSSNSCKLQLHQF